MEVELAIVFILLEDNDVLVKLIHHFDDLLLFFLPLFDGVDPVFNDVTESEEQACSKGNYNLK